mmetsp:Transcript_30247/g.64356  ORF Transcript_30247/g.64356 Transcript_30247/m.64356 type:complete len:217 (-) Transcript_30247:21-671(-)
MSSVKRRHALTISTAVSVLSPVRTQKRMPAALIVSMASGTPSCNLSSMALTPESIKECSSSAATAAMTASRSCFAAPAAIHFWCQCSKKACSMIFDVIARVRKPCNEYCIKCNSDCLSKGSSQRGPMTLSAPLQMQKYSPLYLQMTVIRLRSEVKGISQTTAKTWSPSPGGPLMSNSQFELPGTRRRCTKVIPMACAASRKATSSGELPENTGLPS